MLYNFIIIGDAHPATFPRVLMCNVNCIKWISLNISKEDIHDKRVIEVGALDVNGSARYVIQLLEPREYIGIDIEYGSGVDVICPAEEMVERFGRESFDVVISTSLLEHIRDWKRVVSNIKNICKINGIIYVIIPSVYPYHEYPGDYWRYSREDIKNIFSDCKILTLDEDATPPSLVYAKIRKPEKFSEIDMSNYQLYSIVRNRRITEVDDKDLNSFYFRQFLLRRKIKDLIIKIGRTLLLRL